MTRGSKASYTAKQRRQARHIEQGYEKRGMSPRRAAGIAWATVNKETGGGRLGGRLRKAGRGRRRARPSRR